MRYSSKRYAKSLMQSEWIRKGIVEICHGGDIDVIPRNTFPTTGSKISAISKRQGIRADMRAMHTWSERDHILVYITTVGRILS